MKIDKSDIKWNYLGTLFTLFGNVIMLPLLLLFLTSDEIGLWYVFLSIGGIVILFDFGFGPTLARNIAYSWSGARELSKEDVSGIDNLSNPNLPLMKAVIKACNYIYLIIAIMAFIVLITAGTPYVMHISKEINNTQHIIAWIIYTFAVFLNLYYGYYATLLKGVGAISEHGKSVVISKSIQLILSVLLLKLGSGLIGVAIAYLLSGFIYRLFCKNFFTNYESLGKQLDNIPNDIEVIDVRTTFVRIWHNAWRDGLVALSNYVTTQANVVICSFFLSLSQTGLYAISVQIFQMIASISASLYGTYQPSLQEAYLKRDTERTKQIISIVISIFFALFWIGTIAFILIGVPIIQLFKPEQEFNKAVLFFIGIYFFLFQMHSIFASIISNTNKVPYVKAYVFSSISMICLSVTILSLTSLGIWGLILSQAVVQLCYNNWKWPAMVMQSLNTNLGVVLIKGFEEIRYKVKSSFNS